ncbi:hypothetical protein E4U55_001507 [Claviceps digitariae]|nr:hypothetical protein E4U55_001507 [Claviceps digitariae]
MSGPDRQSPPLPKIKARNPSSPSPTHKHPPPAHDKYAPKPQTSVSLSDIIGPHRSISSFSSFTRVNPLTAQLLDDLTARMTVLAPLNSAIDALDRKPWEERSPDEQHQEQDQDQARQAVYDGDGQEGQERAKHNLDEFVRAHIVMGEAPWEEGVKAETLAGGRRRREIWWEERGDGVRVVCPGGIEVERVAGRVANGELWIVKGVLDDA